jgi:hypothetical protein
MSMPGAFHICIKLSRPWDFRAGQFVYLSIPGVSTTGLFQSHPFVIAWWYKSVDEKKEEIEKRKEIEGKKEISRPDTIVLIAQPRRGFTFDLGRNSQENNLIDLRKRRTSEKPSSCLCSGIDKSFRMKAIVEGPYGEELNLDLYGTVLLFATGVGIAGQIPYVRQLLDDNNRWNSKTRRITLFWEIESESECMIFGERIG